MTAITSGSYRRTQSDSGADPLDRTDMNDPDTSCPRRTLDTGKDQPRRPSPEDGPFGFAISLHQSLDPGAFACPIIDRFVFVRQRCIPQVFATCLMLMGCLPSLWRSVGNPGHLFPPALRTGSVHPVAANQLQTLRRDILGESGEEVQGVKYVEVFLEVLRVCGVE
jgi:hypothetical protein